MKTAARKPFSDLRVLDFTHVLAGPFCTYQLAVLGAEVIKIESPRQPDMMRQAGPDFALSEQDLGLHYLAQSAGKKAITIDIRTVQGRALIERLVRDADVLVENFRCDVMPRLGLGYEDLIKHNPALVYCSMTGFGHTGPKAEHAAYDNVIQAYSGLMSATGSPETGPVKIGPPILDYGTGAQAALAITAALYHRQATGEGQHIDIAMLDAALMLMSSSVVETHVTGRSPGLPGNSNSSIAGYGVYLCADGEQLMIGAFTPMQCSKLWNVLGQSEVADQVAQMNYYDLHCAAQEHRASLGEMLSLQSAEHWEQALNAVGVPASRVRSVQEALNSEQVQSRRGIQQVPHPVEAGASLAVPVAAFGMAQTPPTADSAPPRWSEHTDEVLAEAGLTLSEITQLRDDGVI